MSTDFEIRSDDKGGIDEVVAKGADLHIEQMDDSNWYVGVTLPDGRYWQFNIGAKHQRAHVICTCTDCPDEPTRTDLETGNG